MKKFAHFKVNTRTKLKFSPGEGADVELPSANPVTQYLPTKAPSTSSSIDESMLTGKTYPQADSTSPVKQFPTSSSVMRSTPVEPSVRTNPSPPMSTAISSGQDSGIGRTIKEGRVGSVNITGAISSGADTRKALNPRTLGQSAKGGATGLLNKGRGNDYYRRVLNAL